MAGQALTYALYVCLICICMPYTRMPYMYALYVCLMQAVKRQLAGQALTKQNFMAAYKQQHQADIKDEEEDPHRKLLAEFL